MFVVTLKFTEPRGNSEHLMAAHKAWIKRGFDEGVFMLVGSLAAGAGGGILAHNLSLAELQARLQDDPLVAEQVVRADIIEIKPAQTVAPLTDFFALTT